MGIYGSNIKKFLILQEMKTLKKLLKISEKKAVLKFRENGKIELLYYRK